MPWSEAEEAHRIAHELTPWGAPEGPDPELIPLYVRSSPLCVLLREYDRRTPIVEAATALVERWCNTGRHTGADLTGQMAALVAAVGEGARTDG